MKFLSFFSLSTTLLFLSSETSAFPDHKLAYRSDTHHLDHATIQHLNKRGAAFNGWGTFNQLIDHSNPNLGTFKQRYWYGTEFWNGPGSPIYLINIGEQNAEGFNVTWMSKDYLPGRFAQETGAAVILMEHRYWGNSSPFQLLTVENLTHLTLDNSLKDITYMANNLLLPFDRTNGSHPSKSPWIYMGGSYPGAIANWLAVREPGTFWAYYSSSGVVQAVTDFWQYFVPIQEATPANCTADIHAVIDHVDSVLMKGTSKEKDGLKEYFGLFGLSDVDFAFALAGVLFRWQNVQFYTSGQYDGTVPHYEFCDYVEGIWPNSTTSGMIPGKNGVGLNRALEGYSKYYRDVYVPDNQCNRGLECWQVTNATNPIYQYLGVQQDHRQWQWMLCNEPFEYWYGAPPRTENGGKSMVSRLINVDQFRKRCKLYFPELESGVAINKSASDVNKLTGGWSMTNITRVMHTNGEWDPWRDATLSSSFRDGGKFQGTKQVPVRVIKNGTHCSDLSRANWDANPELEKLMDEVVLNMKVWVDEYYGKTGVYRRRRM
ncbi:peptidase S28 [Podospora fimiseda]|uniref:Peptidase S28 n=1 Tax=Podospora fimiseda TaxID=252190 RepID=A0AAN7GZI2_9PEZI|nr:peptidase S28 [Podospora fimiseda]